MKYFFVLGNHPLLSWAELNSRLGGNQVGHISERIVEVEIPELPPDLIESLGGTIKLGRVLEEGVDTGDAGKLADKISASLPQKSGKTSFGISCYTKRGIDLKRIGQAVKNRLKNQGRSARFVPARERTDYGQFLSSAAVGENRLIEQGGEFVLYESRSGSVLGRTLAVQPYRRLSDRDYGRPARDDYSGMLPPKLAQIMINLACPDPEKTLLDPFCGSGTVLSEALLMGCKNLAGTDISPKAVQDTKANLSWLCSQYNKKDVKIKLSVRPANRLKKIFSPESVGTIVTEPYLGPARGQVDISRIAVELNELYSQSLKIFFEIIEKPGKIVMIWPVFFRNKQYHFLDPDIPDFEIINPRPNAFKHIGGLTKRNTYLYGRAGQKVRREIVMLEAKQ